MAAEKGRAIKKATDQKPRKPRPECTPLLKYLIDYFTVVGLKRGGNTSAVHLLDENFPHTLREDRDIVASIRWGAGQFVRKELKRRFEGKLEHNDLEEFYRDRPIDPKKIFVSHRTDVKKIARDFGISLTEEKVTEIMEAAWDLRGFAGWMKERWEDIEKDRKYLRWAERHYNSLLKSMLADPHLLLVTSEIGVVLGVLDALKAENKKVSEWRKREGFSRPHVLKKKGAEGLLQQEFWNSVVKRLVDVVHPLLKVGTGGRAYLWTRTYDFIARLLNTCYPDVWPKDFKKGAELIKQRHYRTS